MSEQTRLRKIRDNLAGVFIENDLARDVGDAQSMADLLMPMVSRLPVVHGSTGEEQR